MLTSEKLRWSSIDGKSWTASRGDVQFEVHLVEADGEDDIYEAIANRDEITIGSEWFATIQAAKEFCEAYQK